MSLPPSFTEQTTVQNGSSTTTQTTTQFSSVEASSAVATVGLFLLAPYIIMGGLAVGVYYLIKK